MAELTRVVALDCKFIGVSHILRVVYKIGNDYESSILKQFISRWESSDDPDPVGYQCDMVARVSLVNEHLECVLDTFVKPPIIVSDYRTRVSGVTKEDLENGEDFKEVQRKVKEILEGRIVVGHRVNHYLDLLDLTHPTSDIRDTSEYEPFRRGVPYNRKPALRSLAKHHLGITIQDGEPSSVDDARAVMRVYQKVAAKWEKSLAK